LLKEVLEKTGIADASLLALEYLPVCLALVVEGGRRDFCVGYRD
jgi:hypothetical protein